MCQRTSAMFLVYIARVDVAGNGKCKEVWKNETLIYKLICERLMKENNPYVYESPIDFSRKYKIEDESVTTFLNEFTLLEKQSLYRYSVSCYTRVTLLLTPTVTTLTNSSNHSFLSTCLYSSFTRNL